MDIGEHIRRSRKAMGLTQKQLADKAGVGLNFVYQLEKNKPSVQLDCTLQVLAALGLTLKVAEPSSEISPAMPAFVGKTTSSNQKPSLPWND